MCPIQLVPQKPSGSHLLGNWYFYWILYQLLQLDFCVEVCRDSKSALGPDVPAQIIDDRILDQAKLGQICLYCSFLYCFYSSIEKSFFPSISEFL